jgi:hypothetical protein
MNSPVHHEPLVAVAPTFEWVRVLFVDSTNGSVSEVSNEWAFGEQHAVCIGLMIADLECV